MTTDIVSVKYFELKTKNAHGVGFSEHALMPKIIKESEKQNIGLFNIYPTCSMGTLWVCCPVKSINQFLEIIEKCSTSDFTVHNLDFISAMDHLIVKKLITIERCQKFLKIVNNKYGEYCIKSIFKYYQEHQDGYYSSVSVDEMIKIHLDLLMSHERKEDVQESLQKFTALKG